MYIIWYPVSTLMPLFQFKYLIILSLFNVIILLSHDAMQRIICFEWSLDF